MKDRKTWKNRSEEKVVDFSSASLFPARKREVVRRIDYLRFRTQGAGVVKGWKEQCNCGRIPDTFM